MFCERRLLGLVGGQRKTDVVAPGLFLFSDGGCHVLLHAIKPSTRSVHVPAAFQVKQKRSIPKRTILGGPILSVIRSETLERKISILVSRIIVYVMGISAVSPVSFLGPLRGFRSATSARRGTTRTLGSLGWSLEFFTYACLSLMDVTAPGRQSQTRVLPWGMPDLLTDLLLTSFISPAGSRLYGTDPGQGSLCTDSDIVSEQSTANGMSLGPMRPLFDRIQRSRSGTLPKGRNPTVSLSAGR